MPNRWVPDTEGEATLLRNLAAGANDFGEFVRQRVREVEYSLERYHRADQPVRYRDTILQATYLNGELVGGRDVLGGARPRGDTIHTRVYTTSFLGHQLEVTGAKPHDIPIPIGLSSGPLASGMLVIHHPGFQRRPHFVPGLLSAVAQVGAKMRGKAIVGRSEAARLAGRRE